LRFWYALFAAAFIAAPSVFAQSALPNISEQGLQSALLTLDQDRLFAESAYGRRVAREIERATEVLATENRGLEMALSTEERELTERRPSLPPDEFRALADAFNEKVTETRQTQDSKARALTRRADLERRAFLSRVLPILSDIVMDRGAVAILDERAVFLSADGVDITDEAIRRIDISLGDGTNPPSEPPRARPETRQDRVSPEP